MKTKIFLAILFTILSLNIPSTYAWETYSWYDRQLTNWILEIKNSWWSLISLNEVSTAWVINGINSWVFTADDVVVWADRLTEISNWIWQDNQTLEDYNLAVWNWMLWHRVADSWATNTSIWFICENWWGYNINRDLWWWSLSSNNTWGSSTRSTSSTSSSSSSNWWCSSYISSWDTTWSDCNINWNWQSNWTINCVQTPSFSPNTSSCWSLDCVMWDDWVESCSCDTSSCPWDAPSPNTPPVTKTVFAYPNQATSNCDWYQYANNSDSCSITFSFSSSTNDNMWITGWWNNWVISEITDTSWIPADKINNTWKALNFADVSSNWIPSSTSNNFSVEINWIKSRTPFTSNNWKISFKLWWTEMQANNINYDFKKPFVWEIKTFDSIANNWNWQTKLWTLEKYRLSLKPVSNLDINGDRITDYNLNNFSNQIEIYGDWINVQSKIVDNNTLTSKDWTIFNARINSSENATILNQNPWLQINLPIVSYKLWWEIIKYYLSEKDDAEDITPIKTTWWAFLWVKVIWWLEWSWKQEITWQQSNISNLYPSDLRTKIRKNAYSYVKSMTSLQILDWVKYVEWDITISWNQDFETLVVKNWNVTISSDLNSENKVFWIIVLKDNYDVNAWYNWKWNVYIKPDVTKINAIIYADWAVVSVKNSQTVYQTDSYERTSDLKNQLTLNWSLFTRNTIGWAILAWGNYILPGWGKTSDFDLAMQYDLNYTRRWNLWCDKNWNSNCVDVWEYKEPFIIKYDSRVQTNPPKLFSE